MAKPFGKVFERAKRLLSRKASQLSSTPETKTSPAVRQPIVRKPPKVRGASKSRRMQPPRKTFLEIKQTLDPSEYKFELYQGWTFFDGYRRYVPTLVLKDKAGRPHFVLGYHDYPLGSGGRELSIKFIQRDKQSEARGNRILFEDSKSVTAKTREFKNKLGMHPSEFLCSEFLYRFRKEIKNRSMSVVLEPEKVRPETWNAVYRPIIDRFFKEIKITKKFLWSDYKYTFYILDRKKPRVREILKAK